MKKSFFPSYSEIPENENVVIEHTLRYADVDEIKSVIKKYGIEKCQSVWETALVPDDRLRKLNYFLAKFIFNISFDDEVLRMFMKRHSKKRIDRLNEIFNR